MRLFLLFTTCACALVLAWAALVEQPKQNNDAAKSLLDVDSGVEHSNEGVRRARQFYGYYSPLYGYGGYGSYYRPYYGYGRPYYGNYGGYYRPYNVGYGGFYG